MSTVKSKMQNRLSRRCRPQAQTSKTSKRRSIPNSKISHLTELRKAVHIAGAVVSLPSCRRPSPAPPPPPSVLGACSIVSLLLPEVGEARGGYDPRDVGRGHDFAVPKAIVYGCNQDLTSTIRPPASGSVDQNPGVTNFAYASHFLGECKMGDLS